MSQSEQRLNLRVQDWSIRAKIVALLLPLTIVPLLLIAVLLDNRASSALEDEALQGLENQANASTVALNNAIDKIAQDTVLLSTKGDLYFISASVQGRRAILNDHDSVWQYGDIALFTPAGDLNVATGADYVNQNEEAYWQEVVNLPAGSVYFSDILVDSSNGQLGVHVATPSFDEFGNLRGVVRIFWSAENLASIIAPLAAEGQSGAVELINAGGTIVASTLPGRIGDSMVGSEALALAQAGEQGSLTETVNAVESFASYAPVQETDLIAGLGWAVVVHESTSEVLAPVSDARAVTAIVVLIAVIVAVVLALLLSRFIVEPIRRLASVAREIAAGNYAARAPLTSNDEVGTTAAAVNQMLDEVTSLIQTREERDQIQQQIVKLLTEVSGVAEGDLTIEADVTSDALGSVADSFNYMVAELRSIIANVNETTFAVSSASTEIAASSSALAMSSEQQSKQIADTAMAIEEMAISIQQVSGNASMSAAVAVQARDNAVAGSKAVQATIEGMQRIRDEVQETSRTIKRLGESSQEIGSIVQLIEEIANQTNLLALNAAIQAAMAGEHGRGFAVVAEEVRRLAERAGEATQQIGSLVTSIQAETGEAVISMDNSTREVVAGSRLADEAGTALTEIDSVVSRLSELIEAISLAADQQAHAASDISRSMQEISEVTQTTTSGTQQAALSVNNLAGLAERLRQSVSTFKLNRDPDSTQWSAAPSVADGD